MYEGDCIMGLRRLFKNAAAGSVFAFALLATPAMAHEGPPPPMPQYGATMPHQPHFTPPPAFRESWIAEREDRLADGYHHRRKRDVRAFGERCARYFDGYYGYYRSYQPGPGYAHAYPGAAMGYGACCQQPIMMMPAPRMQRREPECTETVEYEYVDVPVRRAPPPKRTKRVKVVPDKRVKAK